MFRTVLAGNTKRLAFLARQVARIGQHRRLPATVVLQRVSCTTIIAIGNSRMCGTISDSLVCIIISISLMCVTVVMQRVSCTTMVAIWHTAHSRCSPLCSRL